ncbi:MAG: hypothetical protein QOG70_1883 [Solirubrobacteraceae bacterium]|nr:hypothetical protein [Solirubrobacteraceae bacterium]
MNALALVIGADGREVAGVRSSDTKRHATRVVARASLTEIVDGR